MRKLTTLMLSTILSISFLPQQIFAVCATIQSQSVTDTHYNCLYLGGNETTFGATAYGTVWFGDSGYNSLSVPITGIPCRDTGGNGLIGGQFGSLTNQLDDTTDPAIAYVLYKLSVGWKDVYGIYCPLTSKEITGCYHTAKSSPIIIAFQRNLELTNAKNGVDFDLSDLGFPQRIGWTAKDSNVAFLVRGNNIKSGLQLFGDQNEQYPNGDEERNGYVALRLLDSNDDGKISSEDSVWNELNLWFDKNHNGTTEEGELVSISNLLSSFSLDYATIGKKDQFGNKIRFRSKVTLNDGSTRFSFDIFPDVISNTIPV